MGKVRTSADILSDLITLGKAANEDRSWVAQSPESDILTAAVSEFARQWAHMTYVRLLTRLTGYEELQTNTELRTVLKTIWEITSDADLDEVFRNDLDNYSEVWGLTRTVAAKAKGVAKMYFSNNDPVTIAQGTKFYSSARRKEYLTAEPISNRTPALASGSYYINVMIEASEAGSDGNIAAGSYLQPEEAISKLVQTIIPVTIENGENVESNEDYVARIRVARVSRGVGSRAYLRNLMLADSRVYDVWINSKNESDFERPLGVDVWVYAQETATSTTDTVKSVHEYVLETQPLINISPIVSTGYTYSVQSSYYNRSVEALANVSGQAIGSSVEYYYDKTIRDLQLQVEDLDNWLLGGRRIVLVKKAIPVKLNFEIKAYYTFGSTQLTVRQNVENNLLYFLVGGTTSYSETFSRKGLGVSIDKSDLLNVVLNTDGIDRVDLNTFSVVKEDLDTTYAEQDPIRLEDYQYATLGTVSWL